MVLLGILIATNAVEQRLNEKQKEIEGIRYESEKKIEQLEKNKRELEEKNKQLESDLRAKKEKEAVRVANQRKTPQRASGGLRQGVEQWRTLVAKHFPPNQVDTALRVMSCESGGNPNALNNNPRTGDYSVGLFQINLFGNLANSRPSEEWLKVPENNISFAARMSRNGWGAWTCYRK